jgi:hypothetical protein
LTAGFGRPNNEDMNHYHFMIDDKGGCHSGHHKVSDNIDCKDGSYAQHCGGGNTGAIGIAMCGMAKFNCNTRTSASNLTMKQVEATCEKVAQLCIEYGIEPTADNVYTHGEFGQLHKDSSSYGKIDIIYIPYLMMYGLDKCGDYLREKIQWYINKIKKGN